MKIYARLRLNTYISLGTVILILFSLVWSWREIVAADTDLDAVYQMRKIAFERILLRDEYLLFQEERSGKQWHAKSEALRNLLAVAETRFGQEADAALLQAARKDFDATFSVFSKVIENRGRRSSGTAETGFNDAELRQISQVILKAYSLTDNINRLHESAQLKSTTARGRGALIAILVICCGIVAIIINSAVIRRTLAKRITTLSQGVEIIGSGNLDYHVAVEGNDELSALAMASNEMAAKLKKTYISVEKLQVEIGERLRAEEMVIQKNLVLEGIGKILREALTAESEEELGRSCLAVAEEVTGSKFGFIGEIGPDGLLHDIAISDPGWEYCTMNDKLGHRRPPGNFTIHGLYGRVLLDGKALLTNDPGSHPDSIGIPDGHPPLHAFLGAPLTREGKTIGMVSVGNREGGYRNEDLEALAALCTAIVQAFMRKRAEQSLSESKERFRIAAETSNDLVYEWDLKQSVQWFGTIDESLGYAPGEFPRTLDGWSTSLHPDDAERVAASIQAHLHENVPYDVEYRVRRKDGDYRWWSARGAVIRSPEGTPVRWVGTVTDTTVSKAAELKLEATVADLQRSNKELEQFAYVASHDLQEPLRMVSSYTQLLAERYKDKLDDKANLFIHYAVDGAVRMQLLINDLLAFSRIGTKGKPLVTVDAHAVLGEVIQNLKMTIKETKAIITNDNLPEVRADSSQLAQLFQNLIGNALKFRGEVYPLIHIAATDEGTEWLFSVRDNGIGIDPQFADKVFVIFQRLHTKEEYPGSGIGLAICKKIVDRHGGRIWFESESGKGATFYFTLHK